MSIKNAKGHGAPSPFLRRNIKQTGISIFDARLGLDEEAAEAWQRHAAQRPTKANPAWREKRHS
jgi:hypothetical protein